jgi:hypothetical protein
VRDPEPHRVRVRRAPRGSRLPDLICSLLHGLGSLEPPKAWRLFTCGWAFYLAAWVVTFATLAVLTRGIPEAQHAVIGLMARSERPCRSSSGRVIRNVLHWVS